MKFILAILPFLTGCMTPYLNCNETCATENMTCDSRILTDSSGSSSSGKKINFWNSESVATKCLPTKDASSLTSYKASASSKIEEAKDFNNLVTGISAVVLGGAIIGLSNQHK